jgi:transposase
VCPGFSGVEISGFWCLTPGGSDGKTGLPAEFRRKVLDLLAEGRSVASVAHDLDVSDQTVYSWRKQDRIDRGLVPGLSTKENGELAAARKRISELENELAIAQRAVDLLKEQTSPKGGTRRSK